MTLIRDKGRLKSDDPQVSSFQIVFEDILIKAAVLAFVVLQFDEVVFLEFRDEAETARLSASPIARRKSNPATHSSRGAVGQLVPGKGQKKNSGQGAKLTSVQ